MPTVQWEELGFAYIGPFDGHNIRELKSALIQARDYSYKPTLVHVVTTKGKGYAPTEGDTVYFHGVSPQNSGARDAPTYSEVFSQNMLHMMKDNPKLVAITPAMPDFT